MQSFNLIGPPDKLGEVFGALYALLVSKILKCIQGGNHVKKKFAVSGLLIGKDYGGARCILSADFEEGLSHLDFKVTVSDTYLAPDTLCALLHFLLDY